MNKPSLPILLAVAVLAAAGSGAWYAASRPPADGGAMQANTPVTTGYTCAMHPQVHSEHPGNCPICGMKLIKEKTAATREPKPLYWYDPMRPDQHFDRPGKSPFMDMPLVPKFGEEGGMRAKGDTVVEIDPRMAQNLGMRTAEVKTGRFWQRVDTVGSVAVDETRIAVVEARAAGWVERLEVRAAGEQVQRGQVLAGLYSPEMLAAQEELALAQKLGDTLLIEGARARLKLLGVSPTSRPQRQSSILAPQSGIVTELMVRQGSQVSPGMPLMKLADLSRVWILVEVPEAQSAWVTARKPAEARLRGLPGKTFEGTVDYVYPMLDSATRTLRARLAFDNADGALKPGMYAEVTVYGGAQQDVILVPSEAVIRTGTRSVVLVVEAEGRYRPVAVTLGAERHDEIVVLDGLQPGQQVVVSGQFLIDSEASLLGAYQRMSQER